MFIISSRRLVSTRTDVSAGGLESFAGFALDTFTSLTGAVSLAAAIGVSFLTGGFAIGFSSLVVLVAELELAENDPSP